MFVRVTSGYLFARLTSAPPGLRLELNFSIDELLIDKDMKKKDLCAAAGISHASMAKLGKNENVTTDVLVKICTALQCDISDIMELTPEKSI